MAEIVFAAGAPHAPAIVGLIDRAPEDAQKVVKNTYAAISRGLRDARPDVLIVFANDHLANSRISAYPDFLIGMAENHTGPHEWFQEWIGCRNYEAKGNPEVAKLLFRGMTQRGIRMNAKEENLKFDDNISVPVVLTDLDRTDITLVPVLQNCTVPPFPDPQRCYDVGKALADFIKNDLPADMRVGLFGSGGLSHEPGGARYFKIDEEFDQTFLSLCAKGDHKALLREITLERLEEAGMGGTAEVLSWFPVMAAIGELPGDSFGYTGWTSFRCGVGGVVWDLNANNRR
jgi:aromatic ring-opening dioxygenase catalytic subunit (LigB family)